MKKNDVKYEDANNKLDEKLSVAELRLYEGFYDGKDRFVPLTKLIVVRNDDVCLDVKTGEECEVYQMIDDVLEPFYTKNNGLELGDLFLSIEKDIPYATNIFDYMIESSDFYYDRLPYLQERFDLYSNNKSSFLLKILAEYKEKILNDREKRRQMKLLLEECEILKKHKNSTGKVLKINTNK